MPGPEENASRARFAVGWLLGLVTAIHLPYILYRRAGAGGDFDLGREMGRRFLAGEPLYDQGLHYPYPPSAAVFFAPLALVPAEVAFVLRYVIAIAALFFMLRRLEAPNRPATSHASLFTVLLAAHYVIRDLDDAGPHLILLAIAVIGLTSVREGVTAACLGFVAAVKPPYVLFLPWFGWTGRWRLAALFLLALVFCTALPMARMGVISWTEHEGRWARVAVRSAVGDPIPGAEESERRVQNQSLGRVLERFGFDDRILALVGATVLAAAVAFRFRGAAAATGAAPTAAVLLLTVLFSPVSWVQHFVVVIPALHRIVSRPSPIARVALPVYAILSLALNRELVGKEAYLTLLGVGIHTGCAVILLGLLFVGGHRRRR